jgi:hypothetical protein
LESTKLIENENKTNANQLEAGVAPHFLAPTAASRPDACTTFVCLRYYRPFIQIGGSASIIEDWSTGFMPAGHGLVVAAQDCARDLRDERVVTCCMLLFSHRACQKSCIIAATRTA